jgi:hypothetical protein
MAVRTQLVEEGGKVGGHGGIDELTDAGPRAETWHYVRVLRHTRSTRLWSEQVTAAAAELRQSSTPIASNAYGLPTRALASLAVSRASAPWPSAPTDFHRVGTVLNGRPPTSIFTW